MATDDLQMKRQMLDVNDNDRKGNKLIKTELHALLGYARNIWSRDRDKVRSTQSEDRDFREHFGCGALVAHSIWELLLEHSLLPPGGCLFHLLWALMFMKVYGKESTMCSLAGGVDKKTFRKWTWFFVNAISNLETYVVS